MSKYSFTDSIVKLKCRNGWSTLNKRYISKQYTIQWPPWEGWHHSFCNNSNRNGMKRNTKWTDNFLELIEWNQVGNWLQIRKFNCNRLISFKRHKWNAIEIDCRKWSLVSLSFLNSGIPRFIYNWRIVESIL